MGERLNNARLISITSVEELSRSRPKEMIPRRELIAPIGGLSKAERKGSAEHLR